jgi:FkbM family methyltransferase
LGRASGINARPLKTLCDNSVDLQGVNGDARWRYLMEQYLHYVATRLGRRLYVWGRRDASNSLASNGEIEVQKRILMSQPPGRVVFVDVGANVGNWAMSALGNAHTLGVDLFVHCVEPVSSTGRLLKRHIVENGLTSQVSIHNIALSDEAGEAPITATEGSGTNSLAPLRGDFERPLEIVQVTTLDAFLEQLGEPGVAFVKLDTEGLDFRVLQGAVVALNAERVPVIQFEYNHRWLATGSSLYTLFVLIDGLGYSLCKVLPDRLMRFARWHPELDRFIEGNYLLVRQDCVSWFTVDDYEFDARNIAIPATQTTVPS